MDQQTLNLRDIHLPEAIFWWPPAPGWWIVSLCLLIVGAAIYIGIKIYQNRQLGREIQAELETIKQQFEETQNKSLLAKSLSTLLRRANISYYPKTNTAGLTGEHWLTHLDKTIGKTRNNISFKSDTGKVLLDAPYLPDNAKLDFDAATLVELCEAWLLSKHPNKAALS